MDRLRSRDEARRKYLEYKASLGAEEKSAPKSITSYQELQKEKFANRIDNAPKSYEELGNDHKQMIDKYFKNGLSEEKVNQLDNKSIQNPSKKFQYDKKKLEQLSEESGWDMATTKKYVADYHNESKQKAGNRLKADTETVDYARAKLAMVEDPEERKALSRLQHGANMAADYNINKYNPYDVLNNNPLNAIRYRNETGEKELEEARNTLKDLGWNDKKIAEYESYAQRYANAIAKGEYDSQLAINKSDNTATKIAKGTANFAYNLAQAPFRGVASTIENYLTKRPDGLGVDVNAPGNVGLTAGQYGTQQVLQNAIGDNHPIAQNLYQFGLSTAESAELAIGAGMFGEAISLAPMALSAANSTYIDARNRGVAEDQAKIYGVAAGTAEVITEKVSLDNLLKMADGTKLGQKAFMSLLAQAGVEASEEAMSDLLNRISEGFIVDEEDTAFNQNKQRYYDELAKRNPNATENWLEKEAKKLAENDFRKEVLIDALGGFFSGGVMGAGAVAIGTANSYARENAISDYYGEKADSITGTSEEDQANKAKYESYKNNPVRAMADEINTDTKEGQTAKETLTALADKVDNGGKLSVVDQANINRATSVAAEAEKRYQEYVKEITKDPNEKINQAYDKNVKIAEEALRKEYSDKQDEIAKIHAEELKTDAEKEVFNRLYEANKDKVGAVSFGVAFDRFYRLGQSNVGFENVINEDNEIYTRWLGEDTVREIYNTGLNEAKSESLNNVIRQVAPESIPDMGSLIDSDGNKIEVTDENVGVDLIAKAFNADIELVDELPNGARATYSVDSNGKIKFSLTKNNVASIFHELGHFAKDFAPQEYSNLKIAMLNAYVKEVGSNSFNEEYSNHVRKYGDITADEITDEMVNSMFVGLMNSEQGRNAFNKFLQTQTQTTAQKIITAIKEFFDNAFNSLKSMFDNSHMSNIERKTLERSFNNQQQLINDYIKTLQAAVDNRNAQNGTQNVQSSEKNAQFEEKHSLNVGDSFKYITEDEYNNYFNIGSREMKKAKRKALSKGQMEIINNIKDFESFLHDGITGARKDVTGIYAKVSDTFADSLIDMSKGIFDAHDYLWALNLNDLKHSFTRHEGAEYVENAPMTEQQLKDAILRSEKGVLVNSKTDDGGKRIDLAVLSDDGIIVLGEIYSNIKGLLTFKHAMRYSTEGFLQKYRNQRSDIVVQKLRDLEGDTFNLPDNNLAPNSNLSQNEENVKNEIKSDSQGRELNKRQKEFYKDAETIDSEGRLKVYHHGTNEYGFDVFDIKKAKSSGLYGRGFYFSDSESHAGTYGQTYDVYLNITKAVKPGTNDITKDQMLNLIKEIANDEDYGIENYGYGATPQSVLDSIWGKDDFAMLADLNTTCVGDYVELVKLFNKVNKTKYNGIIAPTETVAFYSNQIKDVTNLNPTDNESIYKSLNVDDEKDLIAVHNMHPEELIKTLDLGGMPMPSIAVMKAKKSDANAGYGSISVIFDKDTIDPLNNVNNKVYGADAWTPSFPTIDTELNMDRASEVYNKMIDLAKKDGVMMINSVDFHPSNLEDFINRHTNGTYGEASLFEQFKNDYKMKQAYLAESDNQLKEMPTTETVEKMTEQEVEMSKMFVDKIPNVVSLVGLRPPRAIIDRYKDEINAVRREYYKEAFDFTDEEIDNVFANEKPIDGYKELRKAKQYQQYGDTKVTTNEDRAKAEEIIDSRLNKVQYESWLRDLFKGLEGKQGIYNGKEVYTSSGNRKSWNALHYEVNLENIVKAMKNDTQKGGGAFGMGNPLAAATYEFESIEDIKSKKNLLTMEDEETYQKMRSDYTERFTEIATEAVLPGNDRFGAVMDTGQIIVEAVADSKTKAQLNSKLKKEAKFINYSSELVDKVWNLVEDIQAMPTGYFESKPQRAVGLDEIATVILPDNSPTELIERLEDNNINYVLYEEGNEAQRTAIIDMSDKKFSFDVDEAFEYMVYNSENNENDEAIKDYVDSSSILEEGMEALKGQEVDKTKINKVATKLRNDFASTVKHTTFANQLEQVFAYMQTADHVNYRDMMRILTEVARPVVEQSTMKVGEEAYNSFRNTLSDYTIKLNDAQKAEVRSAFGSLGNFRRSMFPINISDNGTELDSIWGEIVDKTGGILDASTSDTNQPLALYDTLKSLKPSVENIYGGDMEDASRDLAMRIVEEYLSLQGDEKSEKAVREIKQKARDYEKKVRERYEAKYNEAYQKIKDAQLQKDNKAAEEIARLKAKNKNDAERSKERKEIKHEKEMVGKEVKKLLKWIEKPTEEHHVPSEMVVPILEFANALDFVTPDIQPTRDGKFKIRVFTHSVTENGKTIPQYETIEADTRDEAIRRYKTALGIGEGVGSQNAKSWISKMNVMEKLLSTARGDSTFENKSMSDFIQNIDPALSNEFSNMLIRNANVASINQLSKEDFNIIKTVLRNITHAVNKQNEAIAQKGKISEWAQSTITRSKDIKLKGHSNIVDSMLKFVGIDMMTPDTFFSFQGKGGEAVLNGLRNGFATKTRDIKKAVDYMQDVVKDISHKEWQEMRGKHAKVYTFNVFGGDSISLTKAQIMSLYELNKRDQAILHYKGGLKADTVYKNGKKVVQDVVHLTDIDRARIFGVLTEKDKKVADAIQWFMANECSKWGNEASKKMYGFEKFLETKYFPISTDSQSIASNNSNINNETLNGIERSGFTKNTNDYAGNAIMIKDIFSVFEKHVEDVAAYHGYAPALKDATRWMNYNSTELIDEENNFSLDSPVKKALNRNVGRSDNAGFEYLQQLIKDINAKETANELSNPFINYAVGNYKAAAIGANSRVVIQQPTAYFRAMNEINPKYLMNPGTLAKSLPGISSVNIARIKEISPMVWWKSQGNYETSLGRSMDEMITGQSNARDWLIEKSMTLAGWADDMTWSALYSAVEKEQRDVTKNLNLSKEEFTQRVNERFDDIITKTQVVDATLQKSAMMRKKTTYAKLSTSFMAEPTKSYNMALKSIMNDYQEHGANALKWKSTRKALAVLMITDIANSLAQSLVDAFRHKDDDEFKERYLKYFEENLLDNVNPLSRIPIIKDMSAKLFSIISGEQTYGKSSDMQSQAIDNILNVVKYGWKRLQGEITGPFTDKEITVYAKGFSGLTGIPAYNLYREFKTIYNAVSDDPFGIEQSNVYSDVMSAVKEDRDLDKISEKLKKALKNGANLNDYESKVSYAFKSDYLQAKENEDTVLMKEIEDKAVKAYMAAGHTKNESMEIINGWEEAKYGISALYKEINGSGDIEGSVNRLLDEGKEPNDIVDKLVEKYGETIDYNEINRIDSEIDDNVVRALKTIDSKYTFEMAQKESKERAEEKAKEQAEAAAKKEAKTNVYVSIDEGSDYKKPIIEYYKAGYDLSDMKKNLTSDYVKPAIKAYFTEGDKESLKKLNRVIQVKAYIDSIKQIKIAKKYNGDYVQYENDELQELLKKYKEEPW